MENRFGITEEGVQIALKIKQHYKSGQPICLPGNGDDILIPEHLLNDNLDLLDFEDPLPLAMVASRDPEPPMAMAAAARLSPKARRTELVTEVFDLLGEITKHNGVRHCVELVSANAFSPQAIAEVRRRTSRVIVHTRQQYTTALRQNMKDLMAGSIAGCTQPSSISTCRGCREVGRSPVGRLGGTCRARICGSTALTVRAAPSIGANNGPSIIRRNNQRTARSSKCRGAFSSTTSRPISSSRP